MAGKILKVKYFSQHDNYIDPWRTCFSSSVAMALDYIKPGSIKNDDDYLREVRKIPGGDTTYPQTHLEVLKNVYGLCVSFSTKLNNSIVKEQIDNDLPVPVGILHRGPSYAPSGGGHWLTIFGYSDDSKAPGGGWFHVHDPWGELMHASGTYDTSYGRGKDLNYSYNLMDARWTVDDTDDGWGILF